MIWGQQSSGGERSKAEIKAKEIERMIGERAGCIRGGSLPIFPNAVAKSPSLSSSPSPFNTPIRKESKRGTRLGFEKNILNHMKLTEEANAKRHEEKMSLFKLLIDKL